MLAEKLDVPTVAQAAGKFLLKDKALLGDWCKEGNELSPSLVAGLFEASLSSLTAGSAWLGVRDRIVYGHNMLFSKNRARVCSFVSKLSFGSLVELLKLMPRDAASESQAQKLEISVPDAAEFTNGQRHDSPVVKVAVGDQTVQVFVTVDPNGSDFLLFLLEDSWSCISQVLCGLRFSCGLLRQHRYTWFCKPGLARLETMGRMQR